LVSALESANLFNDEDTGNHIRRVSDFSGALARLAGRDEAYVKRIRLYASLHDVGKVGISDAILKKPGPYNEEERRTMEQHVLIGSRMLSSESIDPMARNIALYHHEWWNGKGYCQGLAGDDIPLEARIVALADVYDALGTKRVYKDAFPEEKIDAIIREEAGIHFDPNLVDLFLENKQDFILLKEEPTAVSVDTEG